MTTAPRDGRDVLVWIAYPDAISDWEGPGAFVIARWRDGSWRYRNTFQGAPAGWAVLPEPPC